MTHLLVIFAGAALVNNYVLSKFLGICPFLGVSKKVETALGMGIAVAFVMTLASAVTFMVYNYILKVLFVTKIMPDGSALKIDMTFLYNIAFILVIAALVQIVEMFIKKSSPTLYSALGIFLPLITTNCAVLGVTVINMNNNYNLLESIINGLGAAVGFTIAIVLFAGIRERTERCDIPKSFQGFPIALITAALMAIAFLGFTALLGPS